MRSEDKGSRKYSGGGAEVTAVALVPGRAGTAAQWAFAKVPAQRPSRQVHLNGIWEAFPGEGCRGPYQV